MLLEKSGGYIELVRWEKYSIKESQLLEDRDMGSYGLIYIVSYFFEICHINYKLCKDNKSDLVSSSQDGNITTSILTLKVTAENDNAELTCRATNPWFSGGAIEDKRIIRVACKYTHCPHTFLCCFLSDR